MSRSISRSVRAEAQGSSAGPPERIEGPFRDDVPGLVDTGAQVVEIARIVEKVEVGRRPVRRVGRSLTHAAPAAPAQGADAQAEAAAGGARGPALHREREKAILDVGVRFVWRRAGEGADLDLARGADPVVREEPARADRHPAERPGEPVVGAAHVRAPLDADLQAILQVAADPRQVVRDADSVRARTIGRPDAREHEKVRRRKGARRHDGLPFGGRAFAAHQFDAPRAASLHDDAGGLDAGPDLEVRPAPGRFQIGVPDARAPSLVDGHVEGAEPLPTIAVDIPGDGKTGLRAGLDEGPVDREADAVADRGDGPTAAAPGVLLRPWLSRRLE